MVTHSAVNFLSNQKGEAMRALRLGSAAGRCLSLLALGGLRAAEEPKTELKAGDKAPEFTVKDDTDKAWNLSDHSGKSIIVIYFYAVYLTDGLTTQTCGFAGDS